MQSHYAILQQNSLLYVLAQKVNLKFYVKAGMDPCGLGPMRPRKAPSAIMRPADFQIPQSIIVCIM